MIHWGLLFILGVTTICWLFLLQSYSLALWLILNLHFQSIKNSFPTVKWGKYCPFFLPKSTVSFYFHIDIFNPFGTVSVYTVRCSVLCFYLDNQLSSFLKKFFLSLLTRSAHSVNYQVSIYVWLLLNSLFCFLSLFVYLLNPHCLNCSSFMIRLEIW